MGRLQEITPSQPGLIHFESRDGGERQTCKIYAHSPRVATIYPEKGFAAVSLTLEDLRFIVEFLEANAAPQLSESVPIDPIIQKQVAAILKERGFPDYQ